MMSVKLLGSAEDEDELETPVLRPLVWMGDAKRNLQAFPKDAKKTIGDELQLIQFGGMPKDAEPFKGVGSGVFEIALRSVQPGGKIYVLHAFKKRKTAIRPPKHIVDLIKRRYAEAKERAKHEE
jgi:phage-related protein